MGTDLVRPVNRLLAAYNDAAGVTAQFHLNCLTLLNRQLDADLNPDGFRIEIRLLAREQVTAELDAAGLDLLGKWTGPGGDFALTLAGKH